MGGGCNINMKKILTLFGWFIQSYALVLETGNTCDKDEVHYEKSIDGSKQEDTFTWKESKELG